MTPNNKLKAVLWDFGGVITTSPFEAFNRYEAANNIPKDFIRKVNAINPDTNAWARFESSQIGFAQFNVEFALETKNAGHPISGKAVLALLSGEIRPAMVSALNKCAEHFLVGCLTNNVRTGLSLDMAKDKQRAEEVNEVMAIFNAVLESSQVGLRKPDPAFYHKALEALGVAAKETLYLDDLGINLKPAAQMGMQTIKIISESQALKDLSKATGLAFNA